MEAVDTENISEELVIFHCSPTMAGLKAASLFNCPVKNNRTFLENIREMNRRLLPRGVRIVPLKNMGKSVLVYMYRPDRLREDLGDSRARKILAERDYPVEETEKCIVELVRRLEDGEAFPHEIGLFLGYPPEDVDGFIRNGAAGAKCIGTWKVYGNVETAQRKFVQYKAAYCEVFRGLKPGGIFCGCFYVKGENKRSDWFVDKIYTPKGYFTPPYETAGSLEMRLKGMYRKAEVKTVEGMAAFRCRKGKADAQG